MFGYGIVKHLISGCFEAETNKDVSNTSSFMAHRAYMHVQLMQQRDI
jgi:hypothetical protein